MKINKLFIALLALPALLAACSEDDDYSMATVSGDQVYFSNELGETFEISPSASTVKLPVNRIETDKAATYELLVTQPENSKYTIARSVSFAEGENVGYVDINYDPSQIVYGDYEDVTIAIADSLNTCAYGTSTYNFKLGVTAWTDWMDYNSAGTATYVYAQYMAGDDPELPFSYRHNTIQTNLYQFKLEHWFYDTPLVLEYDDATGYVTVPPCGTAYVNPNYGEEVMCTDYNNYWYNIRGKSEADYPPTYGTFDKEQGIFTLQVAYYISLGVFGYGSEYLYIDGVNRLDLSTEVSFDGRYYDAKDNVSLIANVKLGADVSNANVALIAGKQISEEQYNALIDGSLEGLQEVTASGQVFFPADELEDGTYSFIVMPFREGEVQEDGFSMASFEYKSGKETWTLVGTGDYTYTVFFTDEDENGEEIPAVDEGLELYQSDADATCFKIAHWGMDVDFVFTWDKSTGVVNVPENYSGYTHPTYGDVMVLEAADYNPDKYGDYASEYDADESTFYFCVAYAVEAGTFGVGYENFKVNWGAASRSTTATMPTLKDLMVKQQLKLQPFNRMQQKSVKHLKRNVQLQ